MTWRLSNSPTIQAPVSAGPQLRTQAGAWRWFAFGLAVLQCSCQGLAPPGQRAVSGPQAGIAPPAVAVEFSIVSPAPAEAPFPVQRAVGQFPVAADGEFPGQRVAYDPPSLPDNAWTGAPADLPCWPAADPLIAPPAAAWRPPGIGGIWPADEYLFDGGDHPPPAAVLRDWSVVGLDEQDTIVHYDTLDGRTEVEPSNRVPIYAPRFAAIRKVTGIAVNQQRNTPAGVDAPTRAILHDSQHLANTLHQPVQPGRYLGMDGSQSFREDRHAADMNAGIRLDRFTTRFKAYEDFQAIRSGRFDNSEKARLAERLVAAHTWASDQAVQVVIDRVLASLAAGNSRAETVYHYELPAGKPRLRVIKVASQQQAQPGDEIDFTIRFDNVGDQTIGNVTILDNLTTRLDYVPNSAECSPAANFFTEENDAGSQVLRWEVVDPLPVGQGGIARFRCRVR